MSTPRIPWDFRHTVQKLGAQVTQHILIASVPEQRLYLLERSPPPRFVSAFHGYRVWQRSTSLPRRRIASIPHEKQRQTAASVTLLGPHRPAYRLSAVYRVSTSAFGVGQQMDSNRTPLGLHRVSQRIGGGLPPGTVFQGRRPIGLTWLGHPRATIVHRILRLEGMEPGFNKGGRVDSFRRYIYIHGFADEATLGKPQSHGCIHMSADDLIPLFDRLAEGALVWITNQRIGFSQATSR